MAGSRRISSVLVLSLLLFNPAVFIHGDRPKAASSFLHRRGNAQQRDSTTNGERDKEGAAADEGTVDDVAAECGMSLEEIEASYWHGYHYDRQVMSAFEGAGLTNVADYFEAAADEVPDSLCIESVETGEKLTYRQVDERANKVAHWAIKAGVKKGEVVALFMENRPEFIWIWLGFAKAGATIALINTNLEGDLLQHAIQVSKATIVVTSDTLLPAWRGMVASHPPEQSCKLFIYGKTKPHNVPSSRFSERSLPPLLRRMKKDRPDKKCRAGFGQYDPHFYIYTSGTTGKSKAAKFNHKRVIGAGVTWARHMQLKSSDKFYIPLPLYHGNGGVVAVSACWRARCAMVLRRKLSASRFLDDIRRFGCTATIYVGEVWRYICVQPPKSSDRSHPLRVAAGNGLRYETWKEVVDRFGVERLVEHYGQTEMPAAHPMINSYGKVASCGFIPLSVRGSLGTEKLIQYDVENDCAVRGTDGFCREADLAPDGSRTGEAIVKLEEPYSGYTSDEATDKVLYRDVFEKGDTWYHSGDLLRVDRHGFFYFVDRAGDSYRWKGENVSTNEVCEVISQCPVVKEANVYGVTVPSVNTQDGSTNHDTFGKVGMVSVLPREGVETEAFLSQLREHVHANLPSYARPAFVRIRRTENEKTGTYKFKKYDFVQDGFDPKKVTKTSPSHHQADLLYFDHPEEGRYVELTADVYTAITTGAIRL
ncbi:unnamed protein product [Vitrella brassicaformis CCMP3155]|uniref:AMP-dependent synthetase/ligase domain-containing protein n=3 Tax=Vitrella brassicaformis TaxID=1169539 RepID=A0A0G4GM14_VITBC|nr:unnamed protein product [Vitrella brassicaformis CCMP3155]|eukprot:CEM31161.1 unnamed protein product [Vitrella brassicaformis CCMP3155]